MTRATENPEAYNLYLKGRYHWNRWRVDAMRTAAELFERAIAKDPKYAAAWAGFANAYALLCHWTMAPREGWDKAKRAALTALELDPDLSEGHSALGRFFRFTSGTGREQSVRCVAPSSSIRRLPSPVLGTALI